MLVRFSDKDLLQLLVRIFLFHFQQDCAFQLEADEKEDIFRFIEILNAGKVMRKLQKVSLVLSCLLIFVVGGAGSLYKKLVNRKLTSTL